MMTRLFMIFWVILISFVFSFDAEKVIMLNFVLCVYLLYYFLAQNISEHFQVRRIILHDLIKTAIDLQISALKLTIERISIVNNFIIDTVFLSLAYFYKSLNVFFFKIGWKTNICKIYFKAYNIFLSYNINRIFLGLFGLYYKKELSLLNVIDKRVLVYLEFLVVKNNLKKIG